MAEGNEDIPLVLESMFNELLGKSASHKIKIDRAHHALRPKGASTLPRDIICCVNYFTLKEQIMAKARAQCAITYAGASIQLYSELSWIILQKRRHLKPLLLKDQGISYRWGFQFALLASRNGHTATLCTFQDLPSFCTKLDIPLVDFLENPSLASPPEWQLVQRQKKRSRPPTTGSSRSSSGLGNKDCWIRY